MISSIPERCEKADSYDGTEEPVCFPNGDFCQACMAKFHEVIEQSRGPMSPDLREFHDYVSMYKRVLQAGRLTNEEMPGSGAHYRIIANLEKMLRTGSYRHEMVMLRSVLGDMNRK